MGRRTLRALAAHVQPSPAAKAQALTAEPPMLLKDSKGRGALPSVPYTDELPGARDVEVSPEEVAFFKEQGFLVKRGLLDGDALCPALTPCPAHPTPPLSHPQTTQLIPPPSPSPKPAC